MRRGQRLDVLRPHPQPRKLSASVPASKHDSRVSPGPCPRRRASRRPETSALRPQGTRTSGRRGLGLGKLRPEVSGAGARREAAASYRRAGGWSRAALPGARGQLVPRARLLAGAAVRGLAGLRGVEARGGGQQAGTDQQQAGHGGAAGGGHAGGGSLWAPSAASRDRAPAPRLITRLNPPPRPPRCAALRPLPAPARTAASAWVGRARARACE